MSIARHYSVLLVEDDDPLRQILTELLADRGFRTFTADHGAQAVDLARQARPDFGLLDLHLPGGTGLDVLRTIHAELGPMPTIMMSGEASKSETEAAMQAGVFQFLRKPLGFDVLQHSLDRLIQAHFEPPSGPRYGAPGS